MDGCHYGGSFRPGHHFSVVVCDPEGLADERLGGSRTETDDDLRSDQLDFRVEPRHARLNLGSIRFGVNAALAPRLPFEVLHHVRHVHFRADYARIFQTLIQDATCRAHERLTCQVFVVARLFADEHNSNVTGSFTEDGLSSSLIQVAIGAGLCGFFQKG